MSQPRDESLIDYSSYPLEEMPLPRSSPLTFVFDARSVALVGASGTPGKWTNMLLRLMPPSLSRTAQVYPVNPKWEAIEGLPCYPTVASIPAPVDFAQVAVPREAVPVVVRDCAAAGVAVVQILSAGFSEQDERGQAFEAELREIVQETGVRIVGPNSTGLYNASRGWSFTTGCHFEAGQIGLISQSGGLMYDLLRVGQSHGLKFDRAISVGNCVDLDFPEYVDYFAAETTGTLLLAIYVEGVQDGRALFESLRRATRRGIRVVAIKGGQTDAGAASVQTHTGRLAGDHRVWRGMFRQAGVVEVTSFRQLLSTLTGWSVVPPIEGHTEGGVFVIGNGGGASVLLADQCTAAGAALARLTSATHGRLVKAAPQGLVGGSGNPVDIEVDRLARNSGTVLEGVLRVAAQAPEVGSVLIHLNLLPFSDIPEPLKELSLLADAVTRVDMRGRQVTVVLRSVPRGSQLEAMRATAERAFLAASAVVFHDNEDAVMWLASGARRA